MCRMWMERGNDKVMGRVRFEAYGKEAQRRSYHLDPVCSTLLYLASGSWLATATEQQRRSGVALAAAAAHHVHFG